jgi:four helix bundle protein
VAANYRAVCRSLSNAEFIAKVGTVIEEADEAAFWLELLEESSIISEQRISTASGSKRTGENMRRVPAYSV